MWPMIVVLYLGCDRCGERTAAPDVGSTAGTDLSDARAVQGRNGRIGHGDGSKPTFPKETCVPLYKEMLSRRYAEAALACAGQAAMPSEDEIHGEAVGRCAHCTRAADFKACEDRAFPLVHDVCSP